MMLYSALVILSAVVAGFVLGYVLGFAWAAHNGVIDGVRPRTNNKFILFLARPTASFTFAERIVFVLLMLLWLPMFFGWVAIPALVGTALGVEDPLTVKVTYGVLIGALLIGRKFGAKAWQA